MISDYAIGCVAILFILCFFCCLFALVWSSIYVQAADPSLNTGNMVVREEIPTTSSNETVSSMERLQECGKLQGSKTENSLRKREVLVESAKRTQSSSTFHETAGLKSAPHISNSQLYGVPADKEDDNVIRKHVVQNGRVDHSVHMQEADENMVCNTNIIKIKLKFLDDSQKEVYGDLDEDMGSFKRKNIDLQLSPSSVVRLIFNGRLLDENTESLGYYGLFNNCVVHCFISQRPEAQPEPTVLESYNIDISEFFGFIVGVVLVYFWYLFLYHNYIFNIPSIISLLVLTGMVLLMYNPILLTTFMSIISWIHSCLW